MVWRYERLLGLPPLALRTVCDATLRFAGIDHKATKVSEADTKGARARLHELLSQARIPDAMTGASWDDLTALIAQHPRLVLHPPGLWDEIAGNLLSELVVAEGRQWLVRQEAMSRLLEHPDSGQHCVDICISLVDDLGTPVYITPLSLLDVTSDATANGYVLRQLRTPHNDLARHGALLAAIRKVREGHFRTAREWRLLSETAAELASSPSSNPTVRLLTRQFGESLGKRLPGPATNGGPAAAASGAVKRIVDAVIGQLPGDADADPELSTLVAESLFSPNTDERLYATMALAVTPWRAPFAHALLREIHARLRDRNANFLSAALRALTLLKLPIHVGIVRRLLVDPAVPADVRLAAAGSTPHWNAQLGSRGWHELVDAQHRHHLRRPSPLDDSILHSLVYGMATDGHHAALPEMDARYPPAVRSLARWWSVMPTPLLANVKEPGPARAGP